MAGYNETKFAVLSFLDGQGEATAREVADYLDITPFGASSYLLKLHRSGLLGRRRLRKGNRVSRERIYHVTEKGYEKLGWLETTPGAIRTNLVYENEVLGHPFLPFRS